MSTDISNSRLFQPLKVGNITLAHRLALAPLTRYRADDAHVHQQHLAPIYYSQRASFPGTLLITEATFISPQGAGFPNVPGLWDPAQLKAWKQVTDAVHAKGSYIYAQLWALGRAALPEQMKKEFGLDVVSASAIAMPGKEDNVPRELKEDEIWQLVEDYKTAAKNAVEVAGFDGVEIHAANGYLINQFTEDSSNQRTDRWGGSIENRSRFALEVTKAVVEAVGPERTGIRLSPWSTFQGMRMQDPIPQYTHLIQGLSKFKLAYLHLAESRVAGGWDGHGTESLDFAIEAWGKTGPIVLAGGYLPQEARTRVDTELPDRDVIIAFGRYFISNPDLPFRILKRLPLERYDRGKFYIHQSPEGYIDYEFSDQFKDAFPDQFANGSSSKI